MLRGRMEGHQASGFPALAFSATIGLHMRSCRLTQGGSCSARLGAMQHTGPITSVIGVELQCRFLQASTRGSGHAPRARTSVPGSLVKPRKRIWGETCGVGLEALPLPGFWASRASGCQDKLREVQYVFVLRCFSSENHNPKSSTLSRLKHKAY